MSDEPKKLTRIDQATLNKIITKHEYFRQSRGGGSRAKLAHHDLTGLNFAGHDMSHADFTGSVMLDCNFEKTKLDSAQFFACDLRNANFRNASLQRADMRGACLRGAVMAGADLTGADLREGSFATYDPEKGLSFISDGEAWADGSGGVDMRGANLGSVKLSGAIAINSNFADANLGKAKIIGGDLSGANLAGANLSGADLSMCKLQNVSLKGANLAGTLMDFSNLKNVDMTGALTSQPTGPTLSQLDMPLDELLRLHKAWLKSNGTEGKRLDLSGYDLRDAPNLRNAELTMLIAEKTTWHEQDFTGANLQAAQLKGSSFRNCNFSGADLRGTNFSNAIMVSSVFKLARAEPLLLEGRKITMKTDFSNAALRFGDFTQANLAQANFSKADLSSANLTNAILKDANLKDAILTDAKLPQGFKG